MGVQFLLLDNYLLNRKARFFAQGRSRQEEAGITILLPVRRGGYSSLYSDEQL